MASAHCSSARSLQLKRGAQTCKVMLQAPRPMGQKGSRAEAHWFLRLKNGSRSLATPIRAHPGSQSQESRRFTRLR
jgi:hypothetical protein